MSISFIELIEAHKRNLTLCNTETVSERIGSESGLLVIDVREPPEFESASIPGAVNVPRGFLEFRIAEVCPDPDHPILIHCKSGGRAVLAAKTLSEMGYSNVSVFDGAFDDLRAALE